jgi:hypothetical protein
VKAGNVAARVREMLDIAASDRIRYPCEHNGNRARLLQHSRYYWVRGDEDHIRRHRNHVRGCGSHPLGAFASESVIEADVAAFAPPELLKTLPECCEIGLPDRIRLSESHDHANAAHTFALLCARRKGPSCGAAQEDDKIAPFHPDPIASDPPPAGRVRQNIELAWLSQRA